MESKDGMIDKVNFALELYKDFKGARTDLPRLLKELFKNVDDGDGAVLKMQFDKKGDGGS